MDEKDLENILNEDTQDNTAPSENDAVNQEDTTLEEKNGVKYETNDNWEFEAKAPTIDDDLVLENDKFEISFEADTASPSKKNEEETEQADDQGKANQILINKEPLKFIPVALFVALCIAVLSVLGVRYYTVPNGKEGDLMNPGSVVATVDDTKISIGMFNYYYSSIVSYYESYASYGYYKLNTSKDYSTQFTVDDDGNTVSWSEFFQNEALEEIENITTYYNAGIKAGVKLTASQKKTIDEQMESLKSSASESEVTLNQYIQANFGKYCSEDTIRLMLEQYYITANYKGMYATQCSFTDEEIDKYYDAHSDDFKTISFSYLAIECDTTDEETLAKSEKKAQEYMKKMTDADAVIALVPEVYKEYIDADIQSIMESDDSLSKQEATKKAVKNYEENTVADITGSSTPFDDETTNWLFSDNTPVGSSKYYTDEASGYIYIILKTEKAKLSEDNTYTVRHILVMPESKDSDSSDTDQTEYTKEEWAEAEKKANSILEKYNKGDKTEYSFALLAEENSADTASTSASSSEMFGGLYEGVALGEMVASFEEWSTDKSRKYGDTGVVKSDYGYHIMYFINNAPKYKADIITAMRNEKLEEMTKKADIKVRNSVVERAISESKTSADNASDAE